jgi:hypothetical protein
MSYNSLLFFAVFGWTFAAIFAGVSGYLSAKVRALEKLIAALQPCIGGGQGRRHD